MSLARQPPQVQFAACPGARRPGITDVASLEYRDEGERLARAADPEHEYVHVVMPAKLQLAAHYVDHASLAFDLRLILRTLKLIWWR